MFSATNGKKSDFVSYFKRVLSCSGNFVFPLFSCVAPPTGSMRSRQTRRETSGEAACEREKQKRQPPTVWEIKLIIVA